VVDIADQHSVEQAKFAAREDDHPEAVGFIVSTINLGAFDREVLGVIQDKRM
jgi:hypothetical protein|tara:strand:+ start:2648 stop:2803 length:156 start_codon:yes stop_codon:yes gene_type:complete